MRSLLSLWAAATVLSVFVGISCGEKYELKVNLGGQHVNGFVPETDIVQLEEGVPYTRYRGEMNAEPGDEDVEVFKTQRFSRNEDLFMHFPVPDGVYTITLLFAETFEGAFQAGGRVFDVYLGSKPNGIKKVISSLDIFSQVGGLKPLRRKFKGVSSQDGVTLALRPIKQNPQIAGIIFEGHAYQKTFLDDLPTVPQDLGQPLPNFEAVARTGPVVNPTEQMYDPQLNPKFTKEIKAAAASQGVPATSIGQGPGASAVMDNVSPGSSSGFPPGATPSMPPPTGFDSSPSMNPGASPTAPSDFTAPSPSSTFGNPSSMASRGSSLDSTFGDSSSINPGVFTPGTSDSTFESTAFAGNSGGSPSQGLSDSSLGAPTGMAAGASFQISPNPSMGGPTGPSGLAQPQNLAPASSLLSAGAPSLSARPGIVTLAASSQPQYTGRRRLLQENGQASMMQRIQTLNEQIAHAQQHAGRSKPQKPDPYAGGPEMGGRVRASIGNAASIGAAPSMGSTSAQGYSSERMPRYASIHQQPEVPGALPISVRQVEGAQADTPGAPGTDPSQTGDPPSGVSGGIPSGPGISPSDPTQPQTPEAPGSPRDPSYPGPSDPMTPAYPSGSEVPGEAPNHPQAPGAPEQPIPSAPGMPLPGAAGFPGDVAPGSPAAAFPDTPVSAGGAPPPGSDVPGSPGVESPQYPSFPGMPRPVGDAPPEAPGVQEPVYPVMSPPYPSNPSNTESPAMPVAAGDTPPTGSQVPGVPGTQAPVYPGNNPQYPNTPGSSETPSMPGMPTDAPGVPEMPIEANAQIGDSSSHPGISRPGSALNGICINNSTHCSCGVAAPPGAPEEQTCLFIVNETSSPKVCQKSKCNAQFICGCAEGAPMLCERKVARTILTQVGSQLHASATSQADIVLCERIEIEERIDVLEPTLAD